MADFSRHQSALARAVLSSATDFAIVTTDLAGRVTSWNPGAENLLGWTEAEMLGEDACRFFTPEDNASGRCQEEMKIAGEEGRCEDERWHMRKDGSRLWGSGLMLRFEDDQTGEHIGYLKILRDRTAQHDVEQSLRDSEALHRVIASRQQALVELTDRLRDERDPGKISRAAGEIVGRALGADLVGYGVVDRITETITVDADWTAPGARSLEGIAHFRDYGFYIDDLKAGETVIITDAYSDPRTREFAGALAERSAVAFVNTPLHEQGVFVALLYVSQATPRLWTEEELAFIREVAARVRTTAERARADEELRMLAATLETQVSQRTADRNRLWSMTADLMLVAEVDGAIDAVNPAWGRILGWSEADLLGASFLDLIHPDDLSHSREGAAAIGQGRSLARFENRYRHKDGSYRHIIWTAGPADGGIVAVGRDATTEKEQSAALAETEEQLRQSQKMEAVGQLTGGVAHDFNNLLTVIRGSVDLLRRPDLADERRQRYIDAVSDTVDRAAKLTGQLLAFSRRQALIPTIFDLRTKLGGIGEMLDTVTGSRIQLSIDVPDAPCYVRADASQFETALVNLGINARDAMNGAGRLDLKVECGVPLPPIRGHAGSDHRFTSVSIRDTGCGIPGEQLGRIFEPFYTTKEVGKGTGLGLSQVFGFAKQSGGDIDVRSVVDEGTVFTLYLPEIVDPELEVGRADDTRPAEIGAGLCVLVVEDNEDVGQFCTQVLEDLGYRTEWVANAEAALERLGDDGDGFDAVFSDVVMPGMGGVALAETLRDRLPKLPVILTSGYSDILASDADHGFELLHKPYSADRLAETLRRVIGSKGD